MSNLPPPSLRALPTASCSLLVRALFKQPARAPAQEINAVHRLERIDTGHVRRYNEAFGFPADSIPLTYLYLLAQRAQLATMLERAIPFRIAGLIHVANDLALHCPVRPDAPLVLASSLALPEPGANGAVECVLSTQAMDGGQPVFTCTSRYLVKRGEQGKHARPSPRSIPPGAPAGQWAVASDAGRRYAALSGDWNPIHLWAWSARLMGLRQPIIHGMHTIAMACALRQRSTGLAPLQVTCRFRSPVPLGSTVSLLTDAASGAFAAVSGQRIAADGIIKMHPAPR